MEKAPERATDTGLPLRPTEREDPSRTKFRQDKTDPNHTKSRAESGSPERAKARSDKVDPKNVKESTLTASQ
jgi:hypothetical protein